MTKVTVVVPAHNAAAFLDAALASVAGQSRPPHEVLVVDDGSSDQTGARAESWSSRLPITVLRNEKPSGPGPARHLAIQRSTGDAVALLDSDDVWLPDHLEVLTARHESSGGIVTAASLRWAPTKRLASTPSSVRIPVPLDYEEQRREILRRNFVFVGSVFSRSDYDQSGGFEDWIGCEDWNLWIRMIRGGTKVSAAATPTVIYRLHPGSLSAFDRFVVRSIEMLRSLDGLDPDEQVIVDRTVRRLRARQDFTSGCESARAGKTLHARRLWLRALVTDPSLQRGAGASAGQAMRAAAGLLAPRQIAARQLQRAQEAGG